ncbi:phosphodiester glycosidase family protein (plasmid) [Bacillus mycoides]|nr:phosphodiester glycosidase family protein [Bacillus mycoides]
MKKLIRRILLYLFILFLLGTGILFGTSYGHNLRLEAAGTIIATQHRYLAKYTFLSKEELNDLIYQFDHPKWHNSKIEDKHLSQRELEERKNEPLNIRIKSINLPESSKRSGMQLTGKLITINNPFNVKLVTQKGTQGKEKGEQISVMAKRNHALVAVNASGFSDESGRGGAAIPDGIVIENGKTIHSADENDSPVLVTGLTKYGQMITGMYSTHQLMDNKVVFAAGFTPQLIVDGVKMFNGEDPAPGYNPRTIMAQKKDNSIMFLIIDGSRNPLSREMGAKLKECQDILYENGAVNAMAMDGGASTILYAMGNIINKPCGEYGNKGGRYLPNAWVVKVNKGQDVKVTIDDKEKTQEDIKKIIES